MSVRERNHASAAAADGAETELSSRRLFERELLYGEAMETVAAILDEHGITQRELGERLGLSEARISRIMSGRENVTLKTIADLGWAVGIRFAIVPIPFDDRSETPAADDRTQPRWLRKLARDVASTRSAQYPRDVDSQA